MKNLQPCRNLDGAVWPTPFHFQWLWKQ